MQTLAITLKLIRKCPDPSSPSGYGSPYTQQLARVEPDTSVYQYVRWTGTITDPSAGTTVSYTSPSINYSGFVTIGCFWQETIFGWISLETPHYDFGGQALPVQDYEWTGVKKGDTPIPWRSTATITDNSKAFGGMPRFLGGLAQNGYADPASTPAMPYIYITSPTIAQGLTYRITGKWQYVDVNGNLLLEWEGRGDDGWQY